MLREHEDAQGWAMLDYLEGKKAFEVVERDDGYCDVSGGPGIYFLPYEKWNENEKKAMEYVNGRVLDIGCGAGKHSLHLQEKGFKVTGIDISPSAVEVCRRRGLKDVRGISIDEISGDLGQIDTIIMMGNNFGLFENLTKAKKLLRKFHGLTSKDAQIIAETRDPYDTDIPEHLEYHKWNRKRGRMGGQLRLRVIYKKYRTPWFDYLLVSKKELEDILRDTGWTLHKTLGGEMGTYIAVIKKHEE
ncbi:class I SAM-dependent methyltransferase [candidate division WOR-3 bacterium]|nr:class I SAM-dependent methyltransferase [candidate division WOR-3 bacterium]